MFQAFVRLRGEDAAYHLLLVGDGPMRAAVEDESRRSGLQDSVTLVGSVPHEEVPSYLAAMDVAVAPYLPFEDFYYSPLKLYEYMAAGRLASQARSGRWEKLSLTAARDCCTNLITSKGCCIASADCEMTSNSKET